MQTWKAHDVETNNTRYGQKKIKINQHSYRKTENNFVKYPKKNLTKQKADRVNEDSSLSRIFTMTREKNHMR